MKVAFSKIKITPKNVIGVPMAGYTRKEPCSGKLDDIFAHGVLIEGTSQETIKKHILLISLDLLKVPLVLASYIKEKINHQFSFIIKENVLIHAIHTHAAPDLTGEFYWPGGFINVIKGIMFGANRNDRYLVWVTLRIVKMVKDLYNNLKPCKMAWSKEGFNPHIVINRRHPTRKVKPDLGVITFQGINDKELIGFVVNYACHPTTLSYENNKLSADYPGRVIHKIDELTNNKTKAIFFNGAAGDLNPITTCGTDYKKLELDKSVIYDQLGTYKDTERIGSIIAEEALKLAASISDESYFEDVEFVSYLNDFYVPLKDAKYFSKHWFNNKLYYTLKKHFILPVARHQNANFPAFAIKHRFFKTKVKSIIQYIKVRAFSNSGSRTKEFIIFTVPGELFEDIGKNLLSNSPTGKRDSFLFQNSNDWIAYLFPLKEYAEVGGYEPIASFGPLCGNVLEKEILLLFQQVR